MAEKELERTLDITPSLTLKERAHLATLEKRKLRTELEIKELENKLDELTLQINRLKRR